MSKSITLQAGESFTMAKFLDNVSNQLRAQGYDVTVNPMGDAGATITVEKDNDGIKKYAGLGVECTVTVTAMNGAIVANIDSVWTNQIIAFCVGWFLCWIPFITAIIGCMGQSDMVKKTQTALQFSCANS